MKASTPLGSVASVRSASPPRAQGSPIGSAGADAARRFDAASPSGSSPSGSSPSGASLRALHSWGYVGSHGLRQPSSSATTSALPGKQAGWGPSIVYRSPAQALQPMPWWPEVVASKAGATQSIWQLPVQQIPVARLLPGPAGVTSASGYPAWSSPCAKSVATFPGASMVRLPAEALAREAMSAHGKSSAADADESTLSPDAEEDMELLGEAMVGGDQVGTACKIVKQHLSEEGLSTVRRKQLEFVLETLKGSVVITSRRSFEVYEEDVFQKIDDAGLNSCTQAYLKGFTGRNAQKRKTFRETFREVPRANRRDKDSTAIPPPLAEASVELRRELEMAFSWNDFDIFYVNQLSNQRPLKMVTLALMEGHDLFESFAIPVPRLCAFMEEIETQYLDNPYHNSMHAADVAQSVNVLLRGAAKSDFCAIDLLICFFAAACHDVAHPGVTNAFRNAIRDEGSITYNDRSVNENMHCAVTYRTLQRPGCNWLENLAAEQESVIRKSVVDIVLGTDMAHHFDNLKKFKSATDLHGPDVTSWTAPIHALEWIVHCADISLTTKPVPIAQRWTDRLLQEFFRQGDRERELRVPISPLCDRYTVSKVESQIGFVNFIVQPAYQVLKPVCDVRAALCNLDVYYTMYQEEASRERAAAEAEAGEAKEG